MAVQVMQEVVSLTMYYILGYNAEDYLAKGGKINDRKIQRIPKKEFF